MAAQAEGVAKRTDIQTKPKSKFTKVSQKDIDALIEEARNMSLNSGGLNERFQSGFNIARDGFTTAFDLFQTTISFKYKMLINIKFKNSKKSNEKSYNHIYNSLSKNPIITWDIVM